jgi:TonB family protein
MKDLFYFLFLLSPLIFSQSESDDCNKLYHELFGNAVYGFYVETLPGIVGGLDSLQLRLNYPKEALIHKIEGKVYIRVIADTLGNLLCCDVVKGLGYGCTEEALRLINSSHFIPATQRNKKVIVPFVIPIKFEMLK